MLQYLPYLVFVGAVAQVIGIFSYVRDMLRGKTKPNRVTWLMWAIAPLIATTAAITDGVGLSVLPVFMSGFGPLVVFVLSFASKKAYWKLERFDYLCGILSLLALILWIITKEPNIAIAFAIASDLFAAFPTLAKAWKYPETESVGPYTAGLLSSFTSFVAIKQWHFSSYGFPLYLIAVNICIIFSLYGKKLFKKKLAI